MSVSINSATAFMGKKPSNDVSKKPSFFKRVNSSDSFCKSPKEIKETAEKKVVEIVKEKNTINNAAKTTVYPVIAIATGLLVCFNHICKTVCK
ncbi:MAG: hypothetical protein PHV37_00505 [Candidatus Gastranaerophilales bacterium]|nr:hypothetical protein [Candidatus Gastranaerophilales bacterium]